MSFADFENGGEIMATGALVYQLTPRGALRGIRVYADGDLRNTGVLLHKYYTYDITERVIEGGDCVVITPNPSDIQFYHETPVILTELEHPSGRIYVQDTTGEWYTTTHYDRTKPFVKVIDGETFEPLKLALLRNGYIEGESYVKTIPMVETKFLSMYIEVYQEPKKDPLCYYSVKRRKTTDIEDQPVNAVVICATNEDDTKFLITEEFRYTVNKTIIDTPAGLVDSGEDVETTAVRELAEETGYTDVTVTNVLPPSYSSVGMTNECVSVVFVTVHMNEQQAQDLGDGERIKPRWITRDEAKRVLAEDNVAGRTQLLLFNWVNISRTINVF